jgi:hypothetical protein
MFDAESIFKGLLNRLLPNQAAPVLGRVIKAYEGPGKNKYAVDVQVVTAGTLEDTDQVIAEVPISPVWVSRKGMGLYAIPPKDSLVIVEFIAWNPAYPFIAGIYSDEYEAGEFKKDQFVITDGKDITVIIDPAKKIISAKMEKTEVTLEDKKLTATDGTLQVILNNGKAAIKNNSKSLFIILDTLFQTLAAMKTVGSPAQHVVSPDDIAKLQLGKADLGAVMEA